MERPFFASGRGIATAPAPTIYSRSGARPGPELAVQFEQERKANIEAERVRKANTVEAALQAYFASKAHLRTARAREIEMRRELQPWLTRPIQNIGKADVLALINGIRATRPGQARVTFRVIKGFFNWIIQSDDFGIESSPCAKINTETLVGRTKEVDRVLADHEIRAFWRATETLGYPVGSFFRLLLLTGLRRSEASKASWSEFDRAASRWVIPSARMKGARDHLVPLAHEIEALLGGLPRHLGGDFLFSATGGAGSRFRPSRR